MTDGAARITAQALLDSALVVTVDNFGSRLARKPAKKKQNS